MNLTKEEITAIADRLDNIIGDHFRDAIYDTIFELTTYDKSYDELEITDEDILAIKEELKRTL